MAAPPQLLHEPSLVVMAADGRAAAARAWSSSAVMLADGCAAAALVVASFAVMLADARARILGTRTYSLRL
jgi:hypothetical protein